MARKLIPAAIIAVVACTTAGCPRRIPAVLSGPPPAWVDRMPTREGTLCAVGYSGPTFYQQDCVKNAADNSRGHLAETISATIRTVTIDISDGTRGYFNRDVFVEGSETVSAAVLSGSEIEAQWIDLHGQRGAPKGCYALVCIDPSKPISSLVETLEEKKVPSKTVEQVRANAEAAFEELEKEEAKAKPAGSATSDPPAPSDKEEDEKEETGAPDGEEAPATDLDQRPDQSDPPLLPEDPAGEPMPAVREIELPDDR